MTQVDEIEVNFKKLPNKPLDLDAEPVTLNGPIKTPATGLYPVPADTDFGSAEIMDDTDLTYLGYSLIQSKNSLGHLAGFDIHFRWTRKGGTKSGRPEYGKTSKPTGLIRYYSGGADFIVLLAADHCTGMTRYEVEATLFAQLCYAGKDDEGNRILTPPDLHLHSAVVSEYGLSNPAVRAARQALKQLSFSDL